VGNPTVRWHRFGLGYEGHGWLAEDRDRSPSHLLANRLRMPKYRGEKLLIGGDAIASRSWKLRAKKLLRVLPDLGSVCAKGEPQSDQVRLEITIA